MSNGLTIKKLEIRKNKRGINKKEEIHHKNKKLIVYGTSCMWWDYIENAGRYPNGIPCCPHCGSALMQADADGWLKAAEAHTIEGVDNYVKMLHWMRGKCFKSMDVAKKMYLDSTEEEAKPSCN